MREAVISTHVAARRLGLADDNSVDGYVAVDAVGRLGRSHGLVRADGDGVAFTLRATTMDLEVVADLARHGEVLAALDLAESLDIRERRAGVDALNAALKAFRG